MRKKPLIAVLFAALTTLALGAAVPGTAASTVLGADPVGDWGREVDPALGPVGDALGQDLTSAAIEVKDGVVNFNFGLNSLPATGGVPEGARYIWDFLANDQQVELDGKFTNYSRGACDPTSGKCPPPRDPGTTPFFVRGNCSAINGVTTCQELGIVQATFDVAAATISVPVPVRLLNPDAETGCALLETSVGTFGGSLTAIPSAFVSSDAFPYDDMTLDDFRIEAC